MRMVANQISSYGSFAKYVQVTLPKLVRDKRIVDGIKRYSTADEETITRGAAWGQGPLIDVKMLVPSQRPDGRVIYPSGGYTPTTDTIGLSLREVGNFMQGQDVVNSEKHGPVHPVAVTLLHELTHWAWAKAHPDKTEEPAGPEIGFSFEAEVFGAPFGQGDE